MADPNRSIGDVLSDIVDDVQQIVRAEVRLARAEIREQLGRARLAAIFFATAGVAALMAIGLVLLAGVFALATIWPSWAAALAVAAGAALLGGLLWMAGIRHIRTLHVTPQKAIDSVKENIQWAKTRT
jgi:uncharacterized membrane protein YqjE